VPRERGGASARRPHHIKLWTTGDTASPATALDGTEPVSPTPEASAEGLYDAGMTFFFRL